MKKLLTTLCAFVCAAATLSAFSLAACGTKDDGDKDEPHVHTYGDWLKDDTYHWKECSDDGDVAEKAPHTEGDAVAENVIQAETLTSGSYDSVIYCSVCGKELSRSSVVIPAAGYAKGNADVWDGTAAESYAAGEGTQDDPYLIATAEQFYLFAETVNGGETYSGVYFSLICDIDLDGQTWKPIGYNFNYYFSGRFDGRGYKVSNATIEGAQAVGLFGVNQGRISDLGVENVTIASGGYIGALVGANYGTVSGCYSANCTLSIESTGMLYIGGLVGENYTGTVMNSYSTCDVTANTTSAAVCAGGLVGYNYYKNKGGEVTNCYATGNVTAKNTGTSTVCAGGLVGHNYEKGDVYRCFAVGNVSAQSGYAAYGGGIVGRNSGYNLVACYVYSQQSVVAQNKNTECMNFATIAELQKGDILVEIGFDTEIWKFSGTAYPTLVIFD